MNHAIVYGASGIIGWAVVDQLLSSPAFSKVTAVTNRPLNPRKTYWPEGPDQPDLQLVSGVNLRGEVEAIKTALGGDVQTVTHVFYLAFTAVEDDIEEVAVNRQMLQNVLDVHKSSPLQFVAFAGGTRGYGIYAPGGTFTPPLQEDMVNDLPADYAQTVVYPAYRKLLDAASASQGRTWTWCEVCPDAIIGFTPNGSQFSLALHWAQYLSLYAYNHKNGDKTVPYPGTKASADALFTPVSSKTIAQFMIYACLHPEICGNGQLFNIADSKTPCTYGALWPRLAEWFGLVGTPPEDSQKDTTALGVGKIDTSGRSVITPGEYIDTYQDVFAQNGRANAVSAGVGVGHRQLDSVGYWLSFDRQMSLDRLEATGFQPGGDVVRGWIETFELFQRAGLIL